MMDDWKLKTLPVVRLRRPSETFVQFLRVFDIRVDCTGCAKSRRYMCFFLFSLVFVQQCK